MILFILHSITQRGREQKAPHQMEGFRRMLEAEQHVGENDQCPLPYDGIPQPVQHLRVA